MSYQLYRNTTLGATLQESLDELMQLQMLSPALALRVLIQFDKSINTALATRVKNKLHFKADKLNTYRFCDNVWTFMLKEVEFRENSELAKGFYSVNDHIDHQNNSINYVLGRQS